MILHTHGIDLLFVLSLVPVLWVVADRMKRWEARDHYRLWIERLLGRVAAGVGMPYEILISGFVDHHEVEENRMPTPRNPFWPFESKEQMEWPGPTETGRFDCSRPQRSNFPKFCGAECPHCSTLQDLKSVANELGSGWRICCSTCGRDFEVGRPKLIVNAGQVGRALHEQAAGRADRQNIETVTIDGNTFDVRGEPGRLSALSYDPVANRLDQEPPRRPWWHLAMWAIGCAEVVVGALALAVGCVFANALMILGGGTCIVIGVFTVRRFNRGQS